MLGYITIKKTSNIKLEKRYKSKIKYVDAIDDFDCKSLINIKNYKIIKIKIFDSKKEITNDFKLIEILSTSIPQTLDCG